MALAAEMLRCPAWLLPAMEGSGGKVKEQRRPKTKDSHFYSPRPYGAPNYAGMALGKMHQRPNRMQCPAEEGTVAGGMGSG